MHFYFRIRFMVKSLAARQAQSHLCCCKNTEIRLAVTDVRDPFVGAEHRSPFINLFSLELGVSVCALFSSDFAELPTTTPGDDAMVFGWVVDQISPRAVT